MNFFTRMTVSLPSFVRPNPARDWFFVLMVFVILLFSVALFAGYLFFSIEWGTAVGDTASLLTPHQAVTRSELERVVGIYETRGVNFNARNFPVFQLADPSR